MVSLVEAKKLLDDPRPQVLACAATSSTLDVLRLYACVCARACTHAHACVHTCAHAHMAGMQQYAANMQFCEGVYLGLAGRLFF